MKKIILIIVILLILSGRGIGIRRVNEDTTLNLRPNRKLESITWINSDYLIYLTKRMVKNDEAETYEFDQLLDTYDFNGEIIIVETKDEKNLVENSEEEIN